MSLLFQSSKSLKKGTDDLRESPYLELAKRLIGQGYIVKIYDPDVKLDDLMGANLSFSQRLKQLNKHITHDLFSLLEDCESLVICKSFLEKEHLDFIKNKRSHVIDIENSYSLLQEKDLPGRDKNNKNHKIFVDPLELNSNYI